MKRSAIRGRPLTTYEIARMLKVDITSVINWIDQNKLKAYRTPGGHRRIRTEDLLKFLREYNIPIPEEISRLASKRILIVDDDEEILEFISRAIKRFYKDVEIETADDGFSAGKKIAEFKPDLLIVDIRLPGIDGFQVLEHLKKEKMKVIAITAYPTKEIREKIIKAGADDFLAKPFAVEELKQKIENLLKD